MTFQSGNQFWKARSSHGRNSIYTEPEVLLEACNQYFEWIEENPLIEHKPMIVDKTVEMVLVPKIRAMTIEGCARFVRLGYSTWCEYRQKPDFSEVIKEAEEIMREQKFTGAAGGFLNPNIIARDLGLKERSDVTTDDKAITVEYVDSDT